MKFELPRTSVTPVVRRVLQAGKARWGGIEFVTFSEDGSLKTPWGEGKVKGLVYGWELG